MLDLTTFLSEYLQKLDTTFGNRVWFVGLQGSYGRGEATEHSDIDMVVILDELSEVDIESYRTMLDALPHRQLLCGFLSGKREILHWEPADLFQFCYDTTPIRGSLEEILALVNEDSVRRGIKLGACNIYHGCVHNTLYEKSDEILRGLYKSASFVAQAIVFLQTGRYFRHLKDLHGAALPEEREIIDTFLHLKQGGEVAFRPMSQRLFSWAKKWIAEN
jgi:predicted nucleotidyltransferase